MRVHVINTGTELLLGHVTNTHLSFLGDRLQGRGLRIAKQVSVPDGDAIREALLESAPQADLILVTGGLGPTSDDLTRDIVAELAQAPLEYNDEIQARIEERFRTRNLKITDRIRRQAQVPQGATILWNDWGTAPGLYLHGAPGSGPLAGKHVVLLPGPPRELRPMVDTYFMPLLEVIHPLPVTMTQRIFRIVGLGESAVEDKVGAHLEAIADLELGYCARMGEVDLRLIGPQEVVNNAALYVNEVLDTNIVTDTGESFEEVLVRLLTARGETLASAESCTGGLLANRITNVPGSSAIFLQGFVTYANSAKINSLGVPEQLLLDHGAVSEPVAAAMAEGARAASGSTYALATTGIAGPGGGTPEKPVGLVYIALAQPGFATLVERYVIPLDRETFKYAVTQRAFDLLRKRVVGI
jgi:nicotinamide-nucleotide amidase